MAKYRPETMSRKDLRKCYSRYGISIILMMALILGLGYGLSTLLVYFLPELIQDAFWNPILRVALNEVCVYAPAFLVIPLLLGKLPDTAPIPVDRLSLWELLQASVFSMGIGYFFSMLTNIVVLVAEQLTGVESRNIISEFESGLPTWLVVASFVVFAPVMEELIFRKLLLGRLRGLGDTSAVVLSALAFALFHQNLLQMAYAFVLGMVFAAVVLLTGSIRDTILLHMLINGVSVLLTSGVPDSVVTVFGLLIYVLIGVSIGMYLSMRRNYHMEPGPLPFHQRDKRRACFSSVWFWLMLVLGVAVSVATVFLG